jgi:hypothetical protein
MSFFSFIWRWLNSPHCVCGCDGREICRKFEDGHHDGTCAICRHLDPCHLLNQGQS